MSKGVTIVPEGITSDKGMNINELLERNEEMGFNLPQEYLIYRSMKDGILKKDHTYKTLEQRFSKFDEIYTKFREDRTKFKEELMNYFLQFKQNLTELMDAAQESGYDTEIQQTKIFIPYVYFKNNKK